jgi:PAS domain S-box-containing protein
MGRAAAHVTNPESSFLTIMSAHSEPKTQQHEAAMLAWIHDFAPYGVFTTDRDFRIRSWNRWLHAHSHRAAEAMIGRNLFEAFPDLDQRALRGRFERALEGEISVLSTALHGYLLRLDLTVPDGLFEWMQQTARIAPLMCQEETIGTIVVIEDVTQREVQSLLLRRQHARDRILSWALAHLLEAEDPRRTMRDLFCKTVEQSDFDGYLLYLLGPDRATLQLQAAGGLTSETEQRLSVIEASSPIGKLFLECPTARACERLNEANSDSPILAEAFGFSVCALLPLAASEGLIGILCFGSRTRLTLQDGELDLLATIGKYLAVALHKEATSRKLHTAQDELNDHAQNLERQVAERTSKLRETIAELETFSHTLAHDLRAPIRGLIGYCEVMIEDYAKSLPEEGKTIVSRLHRACQHLDTLTRDLLEFSKVSSQDIKLSPVDIGEVVGDILSLSPAAARSLVVGEPLHRVLAHRGSLQQCIFNLIDNALKFTKNGQPPKVLLWTELSPAPEASNRKDRGGPFSSARVDEETPAIAPSGPIPEPLVHANRVRIIVQDQGIGVPADVHSKIFGIFERGTSSPQYQGSGIGLAIVARAMQRMGGYCGVESTLGVGSRFWLDLPAA